MQVNQIQRRGAPAKVSFTIQVLTHSASTCTLSSNLKPQPCNRYVTTATMRPSHSHQVALFALVAMGSYLSAEAPGTSAISWQHQATFESPHNDARDKLLSSIDRSVGDWTPSHPRYRLLDALHGFEKYYERQRAEVDRFKNLYKSVTRTQKNVRRCPEWRR